MKGVVRFIYNYSDGKEGFEVSIIEPKGFSIVYNRRLNYRIKIGYAIYQGAVRFTERAGGWICPDLYELEAPFEKVRLSEALLKNGFTRNKVVSLVLDKTEKEITIKK